MMKRVVVVVVKNDADISRVLIVVVSVCCECCVCVLREVVRKGEVRFSKDVDVSEE